jgi:hypothetical protein
MHGNLLAKLTAPHPVDPIADGDLGMLAVADITSEDACSAPPLHRLGRSARFG